MRIRRLIGCVVVAAGAAAVLGAEEMQMKAQRVALFKNGYACVQMRGTLPDSVSVDVKGLPMPMFGTLTWSAPEGVEVAHFVAHKVKGSPVLSAAEQLLRDNVGHQVRIFTRSRRVYDGILVAPMPMQEAPQGSFLTDGESRTTSEQFSPSTVTLLTPRGGIIALAVSEIEMVELVGSANRTTPHEVTAELSVRLREPVFGKPLQLDFVTHGISWLPTYSLEFQEDGQARITERVTVINNLMDLEKVELVLISGQPPLGDEPITSPLVRLVGLRGFLKALERGRDWLGRDSYASGDSGPRAQEMEVDRVWGAANDDEGTDGVMFDAVPCAAVAGESMSHGGGGLGGGVPPRATRTEELTQLSLPGVSSRCGEVIESDIGTFCVPCRHVYTCDLPDQRVLQQVARTGRTMADVWHCVRLTNTASIPWSMGVVTCRKDGRFVARSMLQFTAEGQESLLRLSKTMEASVTCREELLSSGVKQENGQGISDVYRGVISLSNRSDKPMDIELSKAIIGIPTQASDCGSISVTPAYSGNPRSDVSWKLHLEPNETKTCTYTYSFYAN